MRVRRRNMPSTAGEKATCGMLNKFKQCALHFQICTVVLVLLIVCAGTVIGVVAFNVRNQNLSELRIGLPLWPLGGKSERALIVAPHSDDETLGCGGLIRRLENKGVRVKVVLTTNGDGFHVAASRKFHEYRISPDTYIKFGYIRQQESLAALARLGVAKEDVIFLGYPDRGLAHMWLENWQSDNLFKSYYTKETHTPYVDSFHHNAPYCGSSVLSDFKQIISTYHPTTIYYPHSDDQHQDHWAVNCYIVQALYELGLTDKIRSGLYIVHRGDWPVPQGMHTDDPLSPPSCLKGVGTRWHELDLTNADVDQKLDAIHEYKTQFVTKRFITSFARTNEIFGTASPGNIQRVANMGGVNDLSWSKVAPNIIDPTADSLKVDMASGGDLRELRCCYDDKYFYMRAGLAHDFSPNLFYHFYIHGLPDGKARLVNVKVHGHSCDIPGAELSIGLDALEVAVPISKLGNWNAAMVCADTYIKGLEVDRIAWRLLIPEKSKQSSL